MPGGVQLYVATNDGSPHEQLQSSHRPPRGKAWLITRYEQSTPQHDIEYLILNAKYES